jgi:hypothetical protein
MPEWVTAVPGECCEACDYVEGTTRHEGGEVHVYARCGTCGTQWRDVYTYDRSERPGR